MKVDSYLLGGIKTCPIAFTSLRKIFWPYSHSSYQKTEDFSIHSSEFFLLYIIFTLIVIYAKFLWYFETCLLFRNTTFLIYKINYIEEKRRVALNHFYVYQYSFQLLESIRCEMFFFSALHKKQKSSIITLCFYSFHLFLFKVVELLSTKSACKRKH